MPPALTVYYGSTRYVASPKHTVIIGRASDCDLVIPNPYVSHHHARITWTEDGWLLEDMGSANGLSIRGMHTRSVLLTSTTTVMLARNATLTCVVGDPAPAAAQMPSAAPAAQAQAVEAHAVQAQATQARITQPQTAQTPAAQTKAQAPVAPAQQVPVAGPKPSIPARPASSPTPTASAASVVRPPIPPDDRQPTANRRLNQASHTSRPTAISKSSTSSGAAPSTVLAGSTQAAHLESQLTAHRVTGAFDPAHDQEGTIGRDESCTIRINDYLVSRRHCSLASTSNGILLTDLDSANGTYVNGRRVAKIWLEEGDLVTVGNTDLIVHDGVLRDREPLTGTDAVIAENVGLTVGNGTRLLKGINAVFAKGTLTAVIGPSGAGKTTFTSIVAGLNAPTEGHVLFDGYDVQQNIELLRSRIGFVPQDDVVHRKLTVDAALEYAAKLRLPGSTKAERTEIINHVLDELELTGRRGNRVDQLSGGQRKRVSTAIELLTSPELLILDEPTSGLDPALDLTVMTMLRQLADAGRVVIVVTHSLAYINKLCDNVLMLAPGGKPAFFGTVAELGQAFHGQEWADIFTAVASDPDRVYSITEPRKRTQQAKRTIREHPEHEKPAKPFRIKQTVTLVARQLHLIAADPGLLIFLVLLPLFLGLLSLVVPGSHGLGEPDFKDAATEPNQLLSLIILGACFMGSALSVRDIVSERTIYDRERAVGLSPTSYTGSKLIVMGLQTLLQAALLVTAISLGKPHPDHGVLTDSGIPELVMVVWLTAWASAMLGEVGSALVKSGEQTMPLLVILVMAQLVFSGGMIPVTGRDGLEQVSMVFPGRWGFSAAASDIDLNGLLYGPTKVPTFKKDDLWEHTADQFWFDLGILALMVLVFTVVLRVCVSNAAAKLRHR